MIIHDVPLASFYLQHLNYYRLRGYWLPFEDNPAAHTFRQGTTFDSVLNLYIFDRELRLLVMDAIERIEVSVRSQWAYHLALRYGSHAQMDVRIHKDSGMHSESLSKMKHDVNKSREEAFILHFIKNYNEPVPPIWASCEIMSLGTLSKWYANLKPRQTRKEIARVYAINDELLESWLHHLTFVRNICAHHGRLWNRAFTILPKTPRRPSLQITAEFLVSSRKLYNTILILLHFMDIVSPAHTWRQRFKDLIKIHAIQENNMDFPQNWMQSRLWI